MKFDLWMEGFTATGERATAQFLGTYEAATLTGAVHQWADEKPDRERYLGMTRDMRPTYWNCRIFDNEEDARASFG